MIVEQNSRGRIFIDSFEVKKLAVNYITDNFNSFDCIDVKVKNPNMEITLRACTDYPLDTLNEVRIQLIEMYKTRVHLDIKQLDITIL